MVNIETGVDKLVELVKQKHKVSVVDAAKILGVSKTLIQEWESFLEEEKLIDINYSLTNTILVERKVTEEDLSKKKVEFKNLKEMFARKIDTFLQSIDKDSDGLDFLKRDFDKLKKELSVEVSKVKDELKELETYESLKQDIDAQILEQQAAYKKKIEEAHSQILSEEKRYNDIIKSLDAEKETLTQETKQVNTLESQEQKLIKKVDEINKLIYQIDSNVSNENEKIEDTKGRIKDLEKSANEIIDELKKKKSVFNPLLEEGTRHEAKIKEMQDELLKKVGAKKKVITEAADEGEKVLENFSKFFNKKKEIEELFNKIEKDQSDLKDELNILLKKSKILEITADGHNAKEAIDELKVNMKKVDQKKNLFQDELQRLKSLVKFK